MSKIDVLNLTGEKVKEKDINSKVWGIEPNDAVLHNAIVLAMSNARQSSASTKTRSEVSGGGRKPWRQKGTGNARQGSIRATQWRGGGIVFGPTPNKNYTKKQNKKERRIAIKSALAYKLADKELIVVDKLDFKTNKTREMIEVLEKLNIRNNKVLVVVSELTDNLCLATRNIPNVKLITFDEVNVYDTVNADNMLITEEALAKLEEVLVNE